MGNIVIKCPSCQVALQLSVPEGISEAMEEGIKQGVDRTLTSMGLAGIDLRGYWGTCQRLKSISNDLAEFLDERVEDVIAQMDWPEKRLADGWKERKCSTEDFYKDNRDYLYDNAKYNNFLMYQVQRLLPLVRIRGQRTLDIGCGIGALVSMLGEQDNESTGYDINPQIIAFAEFLKTKYNLKAKFVTGKPDFSQFDLITALGTFEHFENLEEFVAELGKTMKTNSFLYHYDDFGDQTISPMHFDYSKDMDSWLDNSGFRRITNVWAVKV